MNTEKKLEKLDQLYHQDIHTCSIYLRKALEFIDNPPKEDYEKKRSELTSYLNDIQSMRNRTKSIFK